LGSQADDDVLVHGNAERGGDVDDRLGLTSQETSPSIGTGTIAMLSSSIRSRNLSIRSSSRGIDRDARHIHSIN